MHFQEGALGQEMSRVSDVCEEERERERVRDTNDDEELPGGR
jgi:hypothetical protein